MSENFKKAADNSPSSPHESFSLAIVSAVVEAAANTAQRAQLSGRVVFAIAAILPFLVILTSASLCHCCRERRTRVSEECCNDFSAAPVASDDSPPQWSEMNAEQRLCFLINISEEESVAENAPHVVRSTAAYV